jgi:Holliday junction DNA helicase RuvA
MNLFVLSVLELGIRSISNFHVMLSYLSGKILNKGNGFVIVLVDRVGYKVTINEDLYSRLGVGQEADLYVYQYVRENVLDLYGFETFEKLELFELLISISGIGPKSALNAVYVAPVKEFKETIAGGDPSLLTKVSGVGKKTAERAVLDLSGKIGEVSLSSDGGRNGAGGSDEIEALTGLGYSGQQAMDALRRVDSNITDSGERIREALKILGKGR